MTTEADDLDNEPQEERPGSLPLPQTVIDTGRLFGEAREICIDHRGERYRLRIRWNFAPMP